MKRSGSPDMREASTNNDGGKSGGGNDETGPAEKRQKVTKRKTQNTVKPTKKNKRRKRSASSPNPPDDSKTLGYYLKDTWFKADTSKAAKEGSPDMREASTNNDGGKSGGGNDETGPAEKRQKVTKRKTQNTVKPTKKNKRRKRSASSPNPPDDSKTLGYYLDDTWFKTNMSQEEKDFVRSQSIKSLRIISNLSSVVQDYLKINLAHFLRTGKVTPMDSSPNESHRVAYIDFDIKNSAMLYKRDLNAFMDRVEELFKWKDSAKEEYMAPYFPLIQSSGTGKTKLLHECKTMFDNDHESNVHCELILCHHGEVTHLAWGSDIFSQTLDVKTIGTTQDDRETLWKKLDDFVKNGGKEKVILLFDESQHLINNGDGFHFRSIRWWLRRKQNEHNIVGVFAGTSMSLSNYFAEPPQHSKHSRDVKATYNSGNKLYAPFFEITTTGLVSITSGSEFDKKCWTEFEVAVQYGRPLFARMHLKGELEKALDSILLRMKGGAYKIEQVNVSSCFSILATRLQMGQVSFDLASKQVASGYAYLTHFDPEQPAVADIAYLPDPVCAWLAMSQMIKNCNRFSDWFQPPSFWSKFAIKMYTSALCRPEKGDVGEVAAAFYMLACGDELRWEKSKDLKHLSVPLEKWLKKLQGNNDDSSSVDSTGQASVNFIQVCRNYLRYSLKELQENGLLEHWYRAARASYAYASCPAYDLVIPVRYKHNNQDHYCPMLVSVKNRLSYNSVQREGAVNAMKMVFKDAGIETGLCILLLIGLEDPSQSTIRKKNFSHGRIFTVTIEVPTDDCFEATKLAVCSTCGGGEKSEVMASHSEVALGRGKSAKRLLRSKTKPDMPSSQFLQEIKEGFEDNLTGNDS